MISVTGDQTGPDLFAGFFAPPAPYPEGVVVPQAVWGTKLQKDMWRVLHAREMLVP